MPRLTPAMQAGTRFTPEGWKADLVDLIAPQPGVEPATFQSDIKPLHHKDNRWTTTAAAKFLKNLVLCHFKSDQDKIWQEYSWGKYAIS